MKFITALFITGSAIVAAAQTNDTVVPEFKTEAFRDLVDYCKLHPNICQYMELFIPSGNFTLLPPEDADDDAETQTFQISDIHDTIAMNQKRDLKSYHRYHAHGHKLNSTRKGVKHVHNKRHRFAGSDVVTRGHSQILRDPGYILMAAHYHGGADFL